MIEIREATIEHIPGIFHVRVSVRENALSHGQLRRHGITPESLADDMQHRYRGWVAVDAGAVVGFSFADTETHSIWALFVLPEYEGRGLGRRLMQPAVACLWDCGAERIWLTTGPATRAAGFYRHLGWREVGPAEHGDVCFELQRPKDAAPPSNALAADAS